MVFTIINGFFDIDRSLYESVFINYGLIHTMMKGGPLGQVMSTGIGEADNSFHWDPFFSETLTAYEPFSSTGYDVMTSCHS